MQFGGISFLEDFAKELAKKIRARDKVKHATLMVESIFDYIVTESEHPEALAFSFDRSFTLYEPLITVKERLNKERLKLPGSDITHPRLRYITNKITNIKSLWDLGSGRKVIPSVIFPWLRRFSGYARKNFYGIVEKKGSLNPCFDAASVLEYINNINSKNKKR
jgi:hypothetical protein